MNVLGIATRSLQTGLPNPNRIIQNGKRMGLKGTVPMFGVSLPPRTIYAQNWWGAAFYVPVNCFGTKPWVIVRDGYSGRTKGGTSLAGLLEGFVKISPAMKPLTSTV